MRWKIKKNDRVFVIFGPIPGKANRYGIGKNRFFVDKSVKDFEKKAILQLQTQKTTMKTPITQKCFIHYVFHLTKDKDLDNLEKTINDVLVKANILQDDILITKHFAEKKQDTSEKVLILIRTEAL